VREFAQPLGLDNAYFLQRTWQAAFLDAPQRTLLATETGEGLIAGRHFEPILALIVPLVRAAPSMETLLVFQVGLIGFGAVGAYRIGTSLGLDRPVSVLLSWTWLALPGVWAMGTLDFRTFSLAAPLVVCALAALLETRLILGAVLLLLAATCREEVALLYLLAAPALAWQGRVKKDFRPAWVVAGVGVAWTALVVVLHSEDWGFIQPGELVVQTYDSLGGPGASRALEMLYGQIGGNLALAVIAPLTSLGILATWLSAGAMQALLNATAVHIFAVAIALMAWVHALFLARIGGFLQTRLPTHSRHALRASAGLLFVCTFMGNAHIRMPTPIDEPDAWQLIRKIPTTSAVLTQSRYSPALATRPEIYVSDDWKDEEGISKLIERVEWVLLPERHNWLPRLEDEGFRWLESKGGVVLLQGPQRLVTPGHLTPE